MCGGALAVSRKKSEDFAIFNALRSCKAPCSVLECALMAAGDEGIAAKLRNGEKLSDYEKHLMIDMWLLHLRLGA
jgi:hypothetical protein